MIAAWMLYVTVVTALAAAAAHAAERGLRIAGRPGRWAWVVAMLLAGVVPLAAPLQDRDLAWPVGARTAAGPRPAPADAPRAAPQTTVGAAGAGVALRSTVAVAADSPLSALDRPLRVLWGVGSLAWSGLLVASAVGVARRAARWRPAVVDGVPVLVSHAAGPALVGVLTPEIVLPAWMLDLAPAARSLALAHERAHARARDPLLVAAGAALLVAVPWNLALWYAFSRLRLAVEADCDARVLRAHPDVRAYGALLVDVGERTLVSAGPVAALTGSPTQLARRLDLMIAPPPRHAPLRVAGAALTSLACVAAACRTPRPAAAPAPAAGDVFRTDSARFAATARDDRALDASVVPDSTLRGVRLVRAAELPGAAAGPVVDGACAMRLRHPRSGREYLLRRSFTVAPTTREGATLVTRLERAVGEYEPLDVPSSGGADLTGARLRVDCVTGEAVGWTAGAAPTEAPADRAAAAGRAVVRLTSVGLAGVPRTGDGATVRVLVYASGRARVGVGTAAPEPLTDTLRLDRLPAITADVTDGDVHLVLATPGRMSVGGDVTGGAATHVTATGRHLVLRRGGVGITGGEPLMADTNPAGAAAGALPLTDDATRLLLEARDESDRLRHEYIGIEHLVLALTRRTGSAATAPLAHLGVDGEQVRQTLATIVGPGDSTRAPAPGANRPFTTRTQTVLTLAAESARALGQSQVGTGHVLVGILREGRGVGAQVLGHHGLTTEAADAYVRRLRPSDGPR